MRKKLIAAILALCMVVSLLPVTALAAVQVTVNTATGGSVTADVADTNVTLKVTEDTGYKLAGVVYTIGSDATEYDLDLSTMKFTTTDGVTVTVTPTFEKIDYTVAIDGTVTGGTVSADKPTANYEDTVTLTVTADEGYTAGTPTVVYTVEGDTTPHEVTVTNNSFTMPAGNVTVTPSFTANSYTLTVNTPTNGTVTGMPTGDVTFGTEVILTFAPETGYVLSALTKNDVDVLADVDSNTYTFTMPAEDVTIVATFTEETVEDTTYTVEIAETTNGTVTADPASAVEGTDIILTITPNANYALTKLTVNGEDVTASVTNNTYTFKMPANNVTVEATFSQSTTDGGDTGDTGDTDTGDGTDDGTGDGTDDGTGDGTDDGTGDGTDDGTGDGTDDGTGDGTVPDPEVVIDVAVEAEVTVDESGTAVIENIDTEALAESVAAALESVVDDTHEADAATIVINAVPEAAEGAEEVVVTAVSVPTEIFTVVAEAAAEAGTEAATVSVVVSTGTIELDLTSLAAIVEAAGGEPVTLTLESTATENLSEQQQAGIEELGLPVFGGFSAHISRPDGGRIGDFRGGNVNLSVPFEVPEGYERDGFRVHYVDDDGRTTEHRTWFVGNLINWSTGHMSDFIIVYDESALETDPVCPRDETCPLTPFTDLDKYAWYHDGIHYCLENGLIVGMTETEFGPQNTLTRAMLVTILWRLEGRPEVDYELTYTDVVDGEYYVEPVRWATSENIVYGYGDVYGVDDNITRQDFVTILWRYAKYKGYDVSATADITGYPDAGNVSEYAAAALQWATGASIISGDTAESGELVLSPTGETTRAQAARMLMVFCGN